MSDYTYSATRARALEHTLLTDTQLELLMGAASFEEAHTHLHETFLAPSIARRPANDIPQILEATLAEAKALLTSIAPEPEVLDILWLEYDFYNLAAIIKGSTKGAPSDEIEALCFTTGTFTPRTVLDHFEAKTLHRLDRHLAAAADRARSFTEVSEVDRITNIAYFQAIRSRAEAIGDRFIHTFVSLLIDFFNVQANLRSLSYGTASDAPRSVYINGGSLPRRSLESTDTLLEALKRIGSPRQWDKAVKEYKDTGSYARIETVFDNYIADYVNEQSVSIFTVASLFSYFLAVKNNVQIIRTVLVSKQTGLSEYEIRKIIRKRYGK